VAGESKDGGGGIPFSGIVGALLVAAAVVVQQTRLDSARPAPGEAKGLLSRSLHQDVETRLWQDPFYAVAQFRERKRQEAVQEGQLGRPRSVLSNDDPLPPDNTHHIEDDLKIWLYSMMCKEQVRDRDKVRLLMPMLVGGRDEESAEMRRRTRYAVISGLTNANFNPDDPDAIGYAYVPKAQRGETAATRVPETLPFEWFKRQTGAGIEWALVVWLDQSQFQDGPVSQLRAIVDKLTPDCLERPQVNRSNWQATVLGPVDTEMLTLVMTALKKEKETGAAGLTPLSIVSASATGVLPSFADSQFYFATGATTFARVIGPDDRLSDALWDELRLRLKHLSVGREQKAAIAVISEHDTDYGRGFSNRLREKRESNGYAVETFSYQRQIDGGRGGTQRPAKRADKEKDGEKGEASQQQQRSHGTSQIDYLARLVGSMQRYAEEQSREFVAIGVFGNDVYDKLLVLRALRPAFPKAHFVTTDMDARLLDPEEAPWTRNLVLATNFGLTLDHRIQGGSSPFRDGYQTSSYLVALLFGGGCAVDVVKQYADRKVLPPWLGAPLLFEIGRHGAVPLAAVHGGDPVPSGARLSGCDFGAKTDFALDDARIQPSHKQPKLSGRAQFLICLLAAVALAFLSVWALRHPVPLRQFAKHDAGVRARLRWTSLWLAAGCIATFVLVLAIGYCWPTMPLFLYLILGVLIGVSLCFGLWRLSEGLATGRSRLQCLGVALAAPALMLVVWAAAPAITANAEPFAWLEGVSVWPTQLLRVSAALLAGFSVWYIGSASAQNMRELAAGFKFTGVDTAVAKRRASLRELWRAGKRHFTRFLRRSVMRFNPAAPIKPTTRKARSMERLWRMYSGRRSPRIGWTLIAAVGYFAVCALLMATSDARPGMPIRGDHAPEVAALLGLNIILGVVLLVSMMFGCGAFIFWVLRPAQQAIPLFTPDRIKEFKIAYKLVKEGDEGDKSDLFRRFADACLAVSLAAQRSASLTTLIYLPFTVFALMVVARSPLFDNWDTPLGLAIVLCLPFVAVIGCTLWLRVATLRFHRKAIRKAERELIRLRGAEGVTDAQRWQLEKLFEKLRDEKRGSFQSIALQPMVRALLLPLGGYSGIELLEHFVLAG
jgi:hypothetical protein